MKTKKLENAITLFEDFTGHEPRTVEVHSKPEFPDVALKVGRCLGIMYETVRDGKRERYLHEFKKSASPILIASHDGKKLFLLGGNYTFTDAGITDK